MVTRHSCSTVRPPAPESKMPIGRGSTAPDSREARGVLPYSVGVVLEVWKPDGAFGAVEDYLRGEGFFTGAAGDFADLFLAYGLSRSIRREPHPDPPEPCRLPL